MTQIKFPGVFTTDRGAYVTGTAYNQGDIVHTELGVYRSNVAANATHPDTDTTGAWETWCDLRDVAAAKEVVNGSLTDIANLTTQQLLAIQTRSIGIEWSLDDTVKTIEYVGNTSLEEAFKTWCDTSARPCEIKKDGTDFAYLTNTAGVASSTNWLTREDGSGSHYQSEDKADYLQMVEVQNVNVGFFIDNVARRMSVWFNWDKACPVGFRRWLKADSKLFARYDATLNAGGGYDIMAGASCGTSWSMSADKHLTTCKATGSGVLAQTYWEILVLDWLQLAYYKQFDIPSSARGRGIESGSSTAAYNFVNGTHDSLTTPHGTAPGTTYGGYRWMWMENPTDGKQWLWGAGTNKQNGKLYLTLDDTVAQKSTLLSTADADVVDSFVPHTAGWKYPKNIDHWGMSAETDGGSTSTATCDGIYDDGSSSKVVYVGGGSVGGLACGPFSRTLDLSASTSGWGRRGRCTLSR